MNDEAAPEGGGVRDDGQGQLAGADQTLPSPASSPAGALHRPWRLVTAGCEVLVAAAAVWCAIRIWSLGATTLILTLSDGTRLASQRLFGSWLAGAIGLGLLAAILLIDAVREVLLGVEVKRRRRGKGPAVEEVTGDLDDQLTHLNGS